MLHTRLLFAALALAGALPAFPQAIPQTGDWPAYGRDPGGARYSPLDQINTKNVATAAARMDISHRERGRSFESTPIVVDNVLYLLDANSEDRRPRSGNRPRNLAVRSESERPRESRRLVLAGRRENSAAHSVRYRRRPPDRARRQDRAFPCQASATTAWSTCEPASPTSFPKPPMASPRRPPSIAIW